jgi:excisionase family DNA binding protein
MQETKSLMTVKQAAALLAVSPSFVYRAVEKGLIPHVRMGTGIRFTNTDLRTFVLRNKWDYPQAGVNMNYGNPY